MTAAGATGDTLNQMLQFLGVRNIDDLNSNFLKMAAVFESNSERDSNCPDLSFVSGIWVSYTHELKDSFKELVNTLYKTEAKSVDFQRKEEVVKEANLWASVASKGLIAEVLKTEYLNQYTTILFANALYFKGTWKEIFDEQQTRNKDFYLLNGDKISVPFDWLQRFSVWII
ncbi:serpin-ZX-like isoform X2 [Nicotiana sylvestris]|uniref:Serpin-ZX-like n=1 Tax=Nicotiana sylvestris TaxID=4096 RepID=A0A1U7VIE4_NICSY|nr:PREDICTED: serpin-ZX-like [Nicotiana sylvestris]